MCRLRKIKIGEVEGKSPETATRHCSLVRYMTFNFIIFASICIFVSIGAKC